MIRTEGSLRTQHTAALSKPGHRGTPTCRGADQTRPPPDHTIVTPGSARGASTRFPEASEGGGEQRRVWSITTARAPRGPQPTPAPGLCVAGGLILKPGLAGWLIGREMLSGKTGRIQAEFTLK